MILMEDQEVFRDDIIIISPLEELSNDLLSDCIADQLLSPYKATTDFLEEFHMMYEDQLNSSQNDDDATEDTKTTARRFYTEILRTFDSKFSLELDWNLITDMNIEGLRNLAEGIYEFFIIHYSKQIPKCITRIILNNIEALNANLKAEQEMDNVSIDSYKIKLKSLDYALILSSINNVVSNVKNIPLSTEDFIQYFNQDRFEVAVMEYSIRNFIITGNFIPKYLYPIYSDLQDDTYDSIVNEVREKLYQKFKKVSPVTLDDIKPSEDDIEEDENDYGH